jgi:hypothetical protein
MTNTCATWRISHAGCRPPLRRGRDHPEPHPQTKDPTLKTSATTAITVVTIKRPNVTVSYLSASSRFS